MGLFNQIHTAGTGFDGRINHRPLFHLRDTTGNTNDHTGLGQQQRFLTGTAEQCLQQSYRHDMIGNDTILQRMHCHHIARGTPKHIPGFCAHLKNTTGVFVHRHYGRFANHDALAIHINEHFGSSQIHTQITCKKLHKITYPVSYVVLPRQSRQNVLPLHRQLKALCHTPPPSLRWLGYHPKAVSVFPRCSVG